MPLQVTLVALLAVSAALALSMASYALRWRSLPGATSLAIMLLGQGLWAVCNLAEMLTARLHGQIFWDNLAFTATDITVAGLLLFALAYTGRVWLAWRLWPIMLVFSLINLLFVWSDPAHGLVRISPGLTSGGPFSVLDYTYGPWMWIDVSVDYLLAISALFILAWAAVRATRHFRLQAWALVVGLALPVAASLLIVTDSVPIPGLSSLDVAPVTFLLSYPILIWSLFQQRMLEILPVASDMLFEELPDSVLVVDYRERIAAANRQARVSLGKHLLHRPLAEVLPELASDVPTAYRASRLELRRDGSGTRLVLDVANTPLRDRWGRVGGRLVVLRDLTARYEAEESLRQSERAYKALALEHTRLYEEARRQSEQAETLRQAAATVAATLDVQEAVSLILDQLARVVPHDSASVQLRRGESSEVFGCRGFSEPEQIIGLRFPIPDNVLCQAVYLRAEAIILADTSSAEGFVHVPGGPIRSWLALPLVVGERVIGMLALDSRKTDHFTAEHARLGQAFAAQVAIALEHGQLYRREVQARERLTVLQQATREIAAYTAAPDDLYAAVHRATAQLMPAHAFMITLFDATGDAAQSVYLSHQGRPGRGDRHSREGSFAEAVVQHGSPLIIADLASYAGQQPGCYYADLRSGVAVSLRGRDGPRGIIVALSCDPGAYSTEDGALLDLLAAHVATALENRASFAEIEQLATTDPLTGLANRRHFFAQAIEATAQAHKTGEQLSVILLDLDHFKQINDTFGHQAGDEVLRAVAGVCRACLQEHDLLGRYGGEELAVLMPGSSPEAARQTAERIRAAIAALQVPINHQEVRVTASLGVASQAPDYQGDLDNILAHADTALYLAKGGGRNRVVAVSGRSLSREEIEA